MLVESPIWFREQRSNAARKRRVRWWRRSAELGLLAIWLVPLVVAFLTSASSYPRFGEIAAGCAWVSIYLQVLYVSVRALIAGSTAIARERDLQTWETLLSTPIGMSRLVIGKCVTVALPLIREVLITAPFLLVLYLGDNAFLPRLYIPAVATSIVLLSLACVLFFSCLGLLISSRASTATRGATRAVCVGAVIFVGTWLFDHLLASLTGSPSAPISSYLNPYVALNAIMYMGIYWQSPRHYNYDSAFVDPSNTLVTIFLYVGLSVVMLVAIKSMVNKETSR